MNGVILFQSKYGATRKYAGWLSEKTGFPWVDLKQNAPESLESFDTVLYCGGIYASGIAGLSYVKKNWEKLKGKRIAVLAVCASPYDKKAMNQVKNANLVGVLENIPLFYARGAWDQEHMHFGDRTLCSVLRKAIAKKKPEELEPWMKALLEAGDSAADWTDPSYLEPVLEWLNG